MPVRIVTHMFMGGRVRKCESATVGDPVHKLVHVRSSGGKKRVGRIAPACPTGRGRCRQTSGNADLRRMRITAVQFILYVADQARSTAFYRAVLGVDPMLEVPGMTEFGLGAGAKLGLMPEQGIARIISGPMPHPAQGHGVPRCELYLMVDHPDQAVQRALGAGARLVDPAKDRDWGHRVAYLADPDAHVLALAAPVRGKRI